MAGLGKPFRCALLRACSFFTRSSAVRMREVAKRGQGDSIERDAPTRLKPEGTGWNRQGEGFRDLLKRLPKVAMFRLLVDFRFVTFQLTTK